MSLPTAIQQREKKVKRYGWRPDTPDQRDHRGPLRSSEEIKITLPPAADLRANMPPVYDQGELGSCTAMAIAAAVQYDLMKQLQTNFIDTPSRLFIYYNERGIEGTINSDSGAEIRDGIKVISALGNCPEDLWSYDVSKFAVRPSDTAYAQATKHKAVKYLRLYRNPTNRAWTENNIKYCISSLQSPVVFGFSVYESFESEHTARTGDVSMPTIQENLIGGHACLICGYDDSKRKFIVRNSWGDKWGDKGYMYMPYDYLTDENLSDDFWIIQIVVQ